jgi:hypothetical protein
MSLHREIITNDKALTIGKIFKLQWIDTLQLFLYSNLHYFLWGGKIILLTVNLQNMENFNHIRKENANESFKKEILKKIENFIENGRELLENEMKERIRDILSQTKGEPLFVLANSDRRHNDNWSLVGFSHGKMKIEIINWLNEYPYDGDGEAKIRDEGEGLLNLFEKINSKEKFIDLGSFDFDDHHLNRRDVYYDDDIFMFDRSVSADANKKMKRIFINSKFIFSEYLMDRYSPNGEEFKDNYINLLNEYIIGERCHQKDEFYQDLKLYKGFDIDSEGDFNGRVTYEDTLETKILTPDFNLKLAKTTYYFLDKPIKCRLSYGSEPYFDLDENDVIIEKINEMSKIVRDINVEDLLSTEVNNFYLNKYGESGKKMKSVREEKFIKTLEA